MLRSLMTVLLVLSVGVVGVLIAARLGAFAGRAPDDLGVREGRLKAPSQTRNSVSSQAALHAGHPMREAAAIAPLALRGDGPATIGAIASLIETMPGASVVERRADYLRATFRTRWMGFVDDAEFWFEPAANVVQVRSASRVGRGDLGVNRARVESIRERLAARPGLMDRVDAVVVGAGVVGLACARALARGGLDVLVLERERGIGTGVSSRSSEVIHAGLYGPNGSLKATLCARGRALLYDYCAERGIGHRRCGKLVVAAEVAECAALVRIARHARANGVDDTVLLDGGAARALEPALRCAAALHSPSSGIVDSHALMLALQGDAEDAGATFAFGSTFASASRRGAGWIVRSEGVELAARWIVDAAGLGAHRVARSIEGMPAAALPPSYLAKGHYFALAGRAPFSRLIYPIPVEGGLGIHLTLDLAGQARFGPDVQWLDRSDEARIDYAVDPRRAPAFEADIRRYWPALPDGALIPAYAGVRPKIAGRGEPAADFRIDGPAAHGVEGIVLLLGIESPGLTASLAIGERVAGIVARG